MLYIMFWLSWPSGLLSTCKQAVVSLLLSPVYSNPGYITDERNFIHGIYIGIHHQSLEAYANNVKCMNISAPGYTVDCSEFI